MHCQSAEIPTLDEVVGDLQIDLYLNGLQMAGMLSAQLQDEIANAPDENSLKKWYTWTRGLNQLQTFRYAPARQATREQKQRGRPAQEPKIHLNGPAPQLRKPATPKAQSHPVAEPVNAPSAPNEASALFQQDLTSNPSDPYVPSDLYDPSVSNNARTPPASSHSPAPATCAPANPNSAAPQKSAGSQKMVKAPHRPASSTNPTKFDQINRHAETGQTKNLTPISSGQFDQLNAYHASKRLNPAFSVS